MCSHITSSLRANLPMQYVRGSLESGQYSPCDVARELLGCPIAERTARADEIIVIPAHPYDASSGVRVCSAR